MKKILVTSTSDKSLIYNAKNNIYTINKDSRTLTLLSHGQSQSKFYYSLENKNKYYTIAGLIENKSGQLIKIGFLSYHKKVDTI